MSGALVEREQRVAAESRRLPVSAPADERLRAPDDRLGLFATVAIVVGGIVGTGIFTVPAAIADYGWLSVPAFAVVGAGSLALALTFARLVRRTRRSGGPYAYADDAFGQFAGFLAAWTYWIQGWTGHATIAVAGAGYAEALFGLGSSRLTTFAVAGAVLWLPALNNLVGTRSVGAVAVATTVLKITALAIVAVAGLLAFHAGARGPGARARRLVDGAAQRIRPAALLVLGHGGRRRGHQPRA